MLRYVMAVHLRQVGVWFVRIKLCWDKLSYGSSAGVGFSWVSSDQLRQLSYGAVRLVLLRQLSFISLWLGGVRCGAIRLGSYCWVR